MQGAAVTPAHRKRSYILDPKHNLKRRFEIGYELTERLAAKKARFTNNVGSAPNGFYWGIKLGDERQVA